eukprot:SAG31_NODE_10232_length_1167_cov_0.912921_1_plen_56_part_10
MPASAATKCIPSPRRGKRADLIVAILTPVVAMEQSASESMPIGGKDWSAYPFDVLV